MEVPLSLWDSVLELTKVAQEKGTDPLFWAMRLSSCLNSAGVSLPSIELAEILVSYICWENNVPIMWKFLEKALVVKIVPPLLVVALLSLRVIPSRHSRPAAYRVYMELLKRYAFTMKSEISWPSYEKVMNSIDKHLHLSKNFGLQTSEPGILVVEYIFSIVWQLLDASLDDEGLLEPTPEKKSRWAIEPQDMDVDAHNRYDEKRMEQHQMLQKINTVMAVEIIGQFLQDNVTSRILFLARRNMPIHWISFVQQLRILGAQSVPLKKSNIITPEALLKFTSDTHIVLSRDCKRSSLQKLHSVMSFGSLASSRSSMWLPLDLVLEDAMDGYEVTATSAIEIVTSLIKVLQAINATSWHDTFLALWIAALRLVQRERDPIEGPMPHLDTRLCMLLSITTLVVAELIEEEDAESASCGETKCSPMNHSNGKQVSSNLRKDLVSSLQMLGDYQSLLTPSHSLVSAANQAAAKAMMFISGINIGSGYFESIGVQDMPINCSGNMRHLIVEACIARNLLDTSAYYWPGYVY